MNAAELREFARAQAGKSGLPALDELLDAAGGATAAMAAAPSDLRMPDPDGAPGGLLDLPSGPMYILPDLHARTGFLADLLAMPATPEGLPAELPVGGREGTRGSPAGQPGGEMADHGGSRGACADRGRGGPYGAPGLGAPGLGIPADARPLAAMLEAGKASILCLGDILHSEGPEAAARWHAAARDYAAGRYRSAAMDDEMGRSMRCLLIVMRLIESFPGRFFCLKGNHDNISNASTGGDMSFRKYALEGPMGAFWFEDRYGKEALAAVRSYELTLPVAARGRGFCASHAEPAFALGVREIVECRKRPGVVTALIWTDNGAAEEGSVARSLDALLGDGAAAAGAHWFSGHRHVPGPYGTRADGSLVQIHDPNRSQAVLAIQAAADGPGTGRPGWREGLARALSLEVGPQGAVAGDEIPPSPRSTHRT